MKISNLGKRALVGLGLSCGVASTPLTRVNTSSNETSLSPKGNFTRENVIASPLVKGVDEPPDIISSNRILGVGALAVTASIMCWSFCNFYKRKNASLDRSEFGYPNRGLENFQDNEQDIAININGRVNPDQNNNLNREADIVDCQASQSNVLGVEQYTFDQLPPNYEDVCSVTQNIVINDVNVGSSMYTPSAPSEEDVIMNGIGSITFDQLPPNYEEVYNVTQNIVINDVNVGSSMYTPSAPSEEDIIMNGIGSITKDIRALQIFPPDYSNIIKSHFNIQDNSNKKVNVTTNNRHSTRVLPFVSIQCPPNGAFRHNIRPLPINRKLNVTRNGPIDIKVKKPANS